MLQIHAIARDGPPLELVFDGERGILGRSATADIRIDHRTVSREHAEVFKRNGEWWIRDLGGRNGVIVHGTRVEAWKIVGQTQIAIGNYLLTCTVDRDDGFDKTVINTLPGRDEPGFLTEYLQESETRLASRERLAQILAIRQILIREREAPARYAALCEELVGELMSATTAFVIDVDAERPGGPYGVIGKAASELARGPVIDYISRTIMRHLASTNTPVLGSNRPVRQADADAPILTLSEQSGEVVAMGCRFIDRTELGHVRVVYITMPWHMLQRHGAHSPDKLLELSMIAEQVRTVELEIQRKRLEEERLKQQAELDAAAAMQRSLLPDTGLVEQRGVAIRFTPCHQVGGDYVDLVCTPTDPTMLAVLADVSGKGAQAAMVAAQLHSIVRMAPMRGSPAGGHELAAAMDYFLKNHAAVETFATAMIATIHPGRGRVTLLNAGHPPALLWDGAAVRTLSAGRNLLLGIPGSTQQFESEDIDLTPGQRILIYSDGLSELIGADGEQLGTDRLSDLFAEACRGTGPDTRPGAIADRLQDRLDACQGQRAQSDDQTFMVF